MLFKKKKAPITAQDLAAMVLFARWFGLLRSGAAIEPAAMPLAKEVLPSLNELTLSKELAFAFSVWVYVQLRSVMRRLGAPLPQDCLSSSLVPR